MILKSKTRTDLSSLSPHPPSLSLSVALILHIFFLGVSLLFKMLHHSLSCHLPSLPSSAPHPLSRFSHHCPLSLSPSSPSLFFLTSIFLYPPTPLSKVLPFIHFSPPLSFSRYKFLSVLLSLSISLLCAFIFYKLHIIITKVEVICIFDLFSDMWVTHQ